MKKILFLTLVLALVVFSCDDDKDPDPCNCLATYGTTAHLGIGETCTCGGKPCNCTEEKNTTAIPGITIRRDKTITSAQMTAKISGDIVYAWTNLAGAGANDQSKFTDIVKEIRLVPGNDTTRTGDIVSIGVSAETGAVNSFFWGVANGYVQAPQQSKYYLALVTQRFCNIG